MAQPGSGFEGKLPPLVVKSSGVLEGRKFTHPRQPTRLNEWNSVCLSSACHHIKASNDVPADHGLASGPHKPSHDT